MTLLRSNRVKLLVFVAALVLVVGVSGFAMTRGYLMRFYVNDAEISRDAYYQMAYDSLDNPTNTPSLGCTSEWTVGFVYFYEIHCFDSPEALNAYMAG